jgi:Cu(I)/Ag(I) efflux system membrane protein CusA/SilA
MTPSGAQIPLAQLAKINIHKGPGSIKSENSRKTAWVYVDLKTSDIGGWIQQAKQQVSQNVKLPAGYNIVWSGQYEYMVTAAKRLKVVVPLTLVLVVLLLYMSTRSWFNTIVILLAVPFSLVGAVWILYLLNYNISLAVIIGMIALAGVDAETGQVMLLYLENSFDRFKAMGKMNNFQDLWNAVYEGAVMRIRPKFMTVATDFIGLLPLMWAVGTGADTMRRLAAPMVGGILTSFIMELLIYPIVFLIAKNFTLKFK